MRRECLGENLKDNSIVKKKQYSKNAKIKAILSVKTI